MSRLSLNGHRWREVRRQVLERDGHQCLACGAITDLTVDHIQPLNLLNADQWEDGLQYDLDNLRTLCRRCNSIKQDRINVRLTWRNPRWH